MVIPPEGGWCTLSLSPVSAWTLQQKNLKKKRKRQVDLVESTEEAQPERQKKLEKRGKGRQAFKEEQI